MESAFGFPSAASFPRPELRCGYRLMFIPLATKQHCPGNACEFVGDGDDDLVARGSGFELMHPSSEAAGVVLDAIEHRTCTMDEHAAQIFVAPLADAQQSGLTASGALLGTRPSQAAKSRPLRKAAPLPMAATVAVEASGPTPGICRSRWQLASALAMRSISSSASVM